MTTPLTEKITASRLLLGNQYAYLNDRGSYSALPAANEPQQARGAAAPSHVAADRRRLQDPYAHMDGDGGFSALAEEPKRQARYTNAELEQKAKDLQRMLWEAKDQIWVNGAPTDPTEMLDPSLALKFIGFDYELADTLGRYRNDGQPVEVAGIIDRQTRTVRISRQLPYHVRAFTAAHELGHALLHAATGVHRDRPLDGSAPSRDVMELEADKFAAYFLMPEKLVRARFAANFGTECFRLTEATAFALLRGSLVDAQKKCKTLRDLSRLLATADRYNTQQIAPLASQFRVSPEAMAIRLEELGLLAV